MNFFIHWMAQPHPRFAKKKYLVRETMTEKLVQIKSYQRKASVKVEEKRSKKARRLLIQSGKKDKLQKLNNLNNNLLLLPSVLTWKNGLWRYREKRIFPLFLFSLSCSQQFSDKIMFLLETFLGVLNTKKKLSLKAIGKFMDLIFIDFAAQVESSIKICWHLKLREMMMRSRSQLR